MFLQFYLKVFVQIRSSSCLSFVEAHWHKFWLLVKNSWSFSGSYQVLFHAVIKRTIRALLLSLEYLLYGLQAYSMYALIKS